MPIWLRKFTFKQIKDWYDKQQESVSKSSPSKTQIDLVNPDKSKLPETSYKKVKTPNYNMKASQK